MFTAGIRESKMPSFRFCSWHLFIFGRGGSKGSGGFCSDDKGARGLWLIIHQDRCRHRLGACSVFPVQGGTAIARCLQFSPTTKSIMLKQFYYLLSEFKRRLSLWSLNWADSKKNNKLEWHFQDFFLFVGNRMILFQNIISWLLKLKKKGKASIQNLFADHSVGE